MNGWGTFDNRWKLIAGLARRGRERTELHDLLADPFEKQDLAAQQPEVVQRMLAQLHAWQRSVERSLSGADY